MKRRELIQAAMATALFGGATGSLSAADAGAAKQLDRFGGWTGKKFKATGFFRVEKDKRWWFEQWRPHTDLSNANETRDNVEFLQRVVAKYYQT